MADKIDQIKIGNTAYDIDLPPDATPNIASLTVSGSISEGGTSLVDKYAPKSHTQAFSTITSRGEAYLAWGGQSITGGISPVGAALSTEHSANRLAFLNPAALVFETSDDAGSTWTTLNWTSTQKVNHVTLSENLLIGTSSIPVTTSHCSRMTLTAQTGSAGYIYTRPKKLLINMSTSGHGVQVTLEYKTGASGAAWKTLGTYDLSGWSGWNEIDVSSLTTLGGGTTQTSNNWYWRLTYRVTSVNANYTTSRPTIISLRLFGDTCWTKTSTMGETGHLYSYDADQNAYFPGSLSLKTTNVPTNFILDNTTHGSSIIWNMSGGGHYGKVTLRPSAISSPTTSDVLTLYLPNVTGTATKTLATTDHTHALSVVPASNTDTSSITLTHGGKYQLNAGGNQIIFTMPSSGDSNTWRKIQLNGTDKLGTATSTNPLNFKAGSNMIIIEDSGTFTFAATNTWRGIQDNLNSTSTTESLSANQGKFLKAAIDGKAASSHGHGKMDSSGCLSTASVVVITDTNKTISPSSITVTELGYLDGVTSSIQTQLNSKAASNHTHTTNSAIYVDSSNRLCAAGFYASSDRRLKENIKEFIPQKSILDLPVVEFDFKDTKAHTIGCIAQDLKEICPEITKVNEEGYLSIEESKLVYLLLLELKKLKAEVKSLKLS